MTEVTPEHVERAKEQIREARDRLGKRTKAYRLLDAALRQLTRQFETTDMADLFKRLYADSTALTGNEHPFYKHVKKLDNQADYAKDKE